jgi:hypothetical protein
VRSFLLGSAGLARSGRRRAGVPVLDGRRAGLPLLRLTHAVAALGAGDVSAALAANPAH